MRGNHGLVTGIAVAALLAGCTSTSAGRSSSPSGSASVSATASPSGPPVTDSPSAQPSPSESVAAPFGLAPSSAPGVPELSQAGVGVAARVGRHTGYDRVVYEFTGPQPPRFVVRYVQEAIGDPSGEVVDVDGEAILEVLAYGVYYPEHGEAAPPPVSTASLQGTVIASVTPIYGGFEGIAQQFIGLRGDKRFFRVFTLTAPSRLVIDIQTGP